LADNPGGEEKGEHALNRFRINESGVVHETIDGEAVIINLETGSYYSLQSTAVDVWAELGVPISVDDLVAALGGRYTADPADLTLDVQRFLAELQQEDLIVRDASPNGTTTPARPDRHQPKAPFEPFRLQKFTDMTHLLLLDPIHDVDEEIGWPRRKPTAEQQSDYGAPGH
jgi:Coenzyme PQQ synthesis protein D (PqqD)